MSSAEDITQDTTFVVPTVDISPWVSGSGSDPVVVEALATACAEVGFVQVLGHGVPAETIAGLGSAMDAFFDQPLDAKKAYVRPAAENRGYSPPHTESLSLSVGVESASRMNDFFEAYNVGAGVADYPHAPIVDRGVAHHYAPNTWPSVERFQEQVQAYFTEAERVARTLTSIFAVGLGLPADHFEPLTDHSTAVLRMNNYALPDGTDITLDGDLTGMGEHTDFGIVTVLWADQVPGLQVLGSRPDGTAGWYDVSPADDALLVNLGDLTAHLTNERWLSTLHRVKPPIVDGTIRRRRSAAFFFDGNADAVVDTLPGCVDAEHPGLYRPVTIDQHITAKLAGSRAGRLNTGAVREGARVLSAQGRS